MERFAAIDFETANGKRSSVCSVGIVIIEDNHVIDQVYSLIRPYPNYYTQWTTAVHGLTPEDTNEAPDFEEVWAKIAPKVLLYLPAVTKNVSFSSEPSAAYCGCLLRI